MKELKVPAATPTCAMHSVLVVMNVDHPPRSHRIVQIDHSVSYMVMMHHVQNLLKRYMRDLDLMHMQQN